MHMGSIFTQHQVFSGTDAPVHMVILNTTAILLALTLKRFPSFFCKHGGKHDARFQARPYSRTVDP